MSEGTVLGTLFLLGLLVVILALLLGAFWLAVRIWQKRPTRFG